MTSLKDLQAGDVVILDHGRYNLPRPVKIDRVTSTQIVIGAERFRREQGNKIGDTDWHRASIHIPSDGEVEKCVQNLKRQRLASKLRETEWHEFPLATLEAVTAEVERALAAKEKGPQ